MQIYDLMKKTDRLRQLTELIEERKRTLDYRTKSKTDADLLSTEYSISIKHKFRYERGTEEGILTIEDEELETILRILLKNSVKELKELKKTLEGTTIDTSEIDYYMEILLMDEGIWENA